VGIWDTRTWGVRAFGKDVAWFMLLAQPHECICPRVCINKLNFKIIVQLYICCFQHKSVFEYAWKQVAVSLSTRGSRL